MIASVERFVRMQAQRYSRAIRGDALQYDDLLSEGMIGALVAARRFDETAGTKFLTYAAHWIKFYLTRALQNQDRAIRVPAHVLDRRNKIEGDSQKAVNERQRVWDHNLSLDALMPNDSRKPHDWLASNEQGADDALIEAESTDRLYDAIERLHGREKFVMKYRLREETLEQVGARLGVTRERVRQIERVAMLKLREEMVRP